MVNFDSHIDTICIKARQIAGHFEMVYIHKWLLVIKAFITHGRAMLEYSSGVW